MTSEKDRIIALAEKEITKPVTTWQERKAKEKAEAVMEAIIAGNPD